jgi:predicted peptidase
MKRYIVLLTALVTSLFAMAQNFKPMEHDGLLYQELAFNNAEKGNKPLIIYLHGRHASGNDNQKQLSQTGVQDIEKYLRKNAISAYFLVPQCPEDSEWDGRNGKSGCSRKRKIGKFQFG